MDRTSAHEGKEIVQAPTSPTAGTRHYTGRSRLLDEDGRARLRELGEQLPGASVRVIAERLRPALSHSVSDLTVGRELQRMGLRKKGTYAKSPRIQGAAPTTRKDTTRYQDRHRKEPPKEGGYPSDLTDEEWALIEPVIRPARLLSPLGEDTRAVVNALLYMTRTGCQWRYLPRDFPKWNTVAKQYYRWVERGTFEKLNAALRKKIRIEDGRAEQPTAGIIDSQSVKTAEKGGSVDTMAARRSKDASATSS